MNNRMLTRETSESGSLCKVLCSYDEYGSVGRYVYLLDMNVIYSSLSVESMNFGILIR